MLAGRYPSDEFAELRPRIVWDRTARRRSAAATARARLAVTNAGTIPDRGLFGVLLVDGGGRVGELDEEMVYEARAGQTFLLGASTWRIEEITRDRVLVSPAPGVPGAVPFWKGEGVGRPYELGERIGASSRELARWPRRHGRGRALRGEYLPRRARRAQPAHVPARPGRRHRRGPLRPHGRRRAVPGRDRRLARLHPDAVRRRASTRRGRSAITARLRESLGLDAQSIWSDDGIALHLPDADVAAGAAICSLDAGRDRGSRRPGGRPERALRRAVPRERRPGAPDPAAPARAAHAALAAAAQGAVAAPGRPALPGRSPSSSRPTASASRTSSTCPRCDAAAPASQTRRARPRRGRDRHRLAVRAPSLLFDYVATYMYEDDTPPAERRAQALSLDRDLLRELLGRRSSATCSTRTRSRRSSGQLRGAPRDARRASRPAALARRLAARASTTRSSRAPLLDRAAGGRRADRRRGAADRGRGRRAGTATRWASMPPGGLPTSSSRPRDRCGSSSCAMHGARAVHDGRGERALRPRRGAGARRARARGAARPRRAPPGRHRARVVRPRRPPPAAPRVARRAAARGRARRAGRARALPARVARDRPAALRCAKRSYRCRLCRCRCRSGRARSCRGACPGTGPSNSTQLCASGEVVWVGAGLDRVAVYFREDAAALGAPCRRRRQRAERHTTAIRAALGRERDVLVRPARGNRARRRGGAPRRSGSSSGRAR